MWEFSSALLDSRRSHHEKTMKTPPDNKSILPHFFFFSALVAVARSLSVLPKAFRRKFINSWWRTSPSQIPSSRQPPYFSLLQELQPPSRIIKNMEGLERNETKPNKTKDYREKKTLSTNHIVRHMQPPRTNVSTFANLYKIWRRREVERSLEWNEPR